MNKNMLLVIFTALVVLALGAAAVPALAASNAGYGGGTSHPVVVPTASSAAPLTTAETDALLFMREEEKLARDVYTALYARWSLPVFQNIAASEQTHMDQILVLINRYGLKDPAQAAGVFTNPTLQSLYDQLVAQGSASVEQALKTGSQIEQLDITDLQTRLSQTTHSDIQVVFQNLLKASANHLNAFSSTAGNTVGTGGQGRGRGAGRP